MNSNELVTDRLTGLAEDLENALAQALEPLVHDASTFPAFEREAALRDLLALSRGEDAMYDRPTVGIMYALWYQLRRTQDAIRVLGPLLLDRDDDMTVFDLGSGTAAGWLACALVERCRSDIGRPPRRLRVVGVEASVPMRTTGRRLVDILRKSGLLAGTEVTFHDHLASISLSPFHAEGSIAYAGYLFDASDTSRAQEVGRALARTLSESGIETIALTSASSKASLLDEGLSGMTTDTPWKQCAPNPWPTVWNGKCQQLGALRSRLADDLPEAVRNLGCVLPKWSSTETTARRVELDPGFVRQRGLSVSRTSERLILDEKQDLAATPDHRLTAVMGAAGSGKSRVLVERAIRIIESAAAGEPVRMLITTFNKLLIDQLAAWFEEELSERGGSKWRIGGNGDGFKTIEFDNGRVVTFMNWDKAPTRIFGVTDNGPVCGEEAAFEQVLAQLNDSDRERVEQRSWLTASFLAAELRRVVYGQAAFDHSGYMEVTRRGRTPATLQRHDREVVWRLLDTRCRTFIDQRLDALRRVRSGHDARHRYTQVFVDECQDFLPSDFELLAASLEDVHFLCVFGDETQSLHNGSSYRRPGSINGKRWKYHELDGSYRLPIRVCEAVEPLARTLKLRRATEPAEPPQDSTDLSDDDIVLPIAVKTAVLGIRPVVVNGKIGEVKTQMREIFEVYADLLTATTVANRRITVAETDDRMKCIMNELLREGCFPAETIVEPTTMRRVKGLERPAVVWSTAADIPQSDTTAEWIYTILTRTTGLVIIALSEHTTEPIRHIVGQLEPSRLLFWTDRAEQEFNAWRHPAST